MSHSTYLSNKSIVRNKFDLVLLLPTIMSVHIEIKTKFPEIINLT